MRCAQSTEVNNLLLSFIDFLFTKWTMTYSHQWQLIPRTSIQTILWKIFSRGFFPSNLHKIKWITSEQCSNINQNLWKWIRGKVNFPLYLFSFVRLRFNLDLTAIQMVVHRDRVRMAPLHNLFLIKLTSLNIRLLAPIHVHDNFVFNRHLAGKHRGVSKR